MQDRFLKKKIYMVNADLQRFPPRSPPWGVIQVYVSEQSIYSPLPKNAKYKKWQIVKFWNSTIFSYLCRNLGKQRFLFGVFWCAFCFAFRAVLCMEGFLMTKNIGVSAHLSMRKERLLYSKKLVNSFVIRPLQPLISIFTYTIFYVTVPKNN